MKTTILAGVIALTGFGASAAPIKWDVSGMLTDGSTVTGSFVYDVDLGAYSDIAVSITGGTLGDASFVQATSFALETFPDFVEAGGPDFTGLLNFRINQGIDFGDASTLTHMLAANDPGVGVITCVDPDCAFGEDPGASFTVGNVDGVVVPLPAGAWLMLGGLGALAAAKRARRA